MDLFPRKNLKIFSRLRRDNNFSSRLGRRPPQAKSEMTPLGGGGDRPPAPSPPFPPPPIYASELEEIQFEKFMLVLRKNEKKIF